MEQQAETNEVLEEFNKAKATGRQPVCPYCNEPLVSCLKNKRNNFCDNIRQFSMFLPRLTLNLKYETYSIYLRDGTLEISQIQYESINWKWNNKKRAFEKEVSDVDPDKPFCTSCEIKDWDFLNSGLVDF